jgi:DNA-binding transcriptional ArsR family regulator
LIAVELKKNKMILKTVVTKLSDEFKEEMKKLREEIAKLKKQLEEVTENEDRRRRGIYVDIGNRVQDYMQDVMESVAEGVHGELDKSVFIGPRGVRICRRDECHSEEDLYEVDFSKVADVMSALGQEQRLKVLKELASGGKYVNELQEKLSDITASTLSSHLKVLEEAGLVVQEKVRGRYLITMPGRTAYKMAVRVTRFLERGSQE